MSAPSAFRPSLSATLYFDVISPFAYLLHAKLDRQPLPVDLERKPVLFAAMLNAVGQKGPAEIPAKRQATYEYCTWLAEREGIPFLMPAAHPFNPVRYLRLILALGCKASVISGVFEILFTSGLDPEHPDTFAKLIEQLGLEHAEALIETAEVKQQLRSNTDEAIAAGLFGVPTIAVAERLFWGFDALPMLRGYLAGDGSLDTPAMQAARHVRLGTMRRT